MMQLYGVIWKTKNKESKDRVGPIHAYDDHGALCGSHIATAVSWVDYARYYEVTCEACKKIIKERGYTMEPLQKQQ